MNGATLFTDHFGPLAAQDSGSIQRIADVLAGSGLESIRVSDVESAAIKLALDRSAGNCTVAARRLGISVRTPQRKLKAQAEADYLAVSEL